MTETELDIARGKTVLWLREQRHTWHQIDQIMGMKLYFNSDGQHHYKGISAYMLAQRIQKETITR